MMNKVLKKFTALFHMNGYQKIFRRNGTENDGGGLLVYVKDGVCCIRRTDQEHQS